MEFTEALKLALQSLWQNKLRSVLTLLGIVIGVASVIAVVTLVNGANMFIVNKFSSYGADTFTVTKAPSFSTNPDDYQKYAKRKNLLFSDFEYVQQNCRRCTAMGAQQAVTGKLVRGTQAISDAQIRGYTWQMPALQNLDITAGRGLTDADEATPPTSASSAPTSRRTSSPASTPSARSSAPTAPPTPSSASLKSRAAPSASRRITGSASRSPPTRRATAPRNPSPSI